MSKNKAFFDADGTEIKVGDHVKCAKGAKTDHLVIRDPKSGELVRYIDSRPLTSFKRVYLTRTGSEYNGKAKELDQAEARTVPDRRESDGHSEASAARPNDGEAQVRGAVTSRRTPLEGVGLPPATSPTISLYRYRELKLKLRRRTNRLSLWLGGMTLFAAGEAVCILKFAGVI